MSTTVADLVRDAQDIVNGITEAGISAGQDIVRRDEYKLIFDASKSPSERAVLAAGSATIAGTVNATTVRYIRACHYAAALYAVDASDTVLTKSTVALTQAQIDAVKDARLMEIIQGAITLILSTKVSWWSTNHHIGTGSGFPTTITRK